MMFDKPYEGEGHLKPSLLKLEKKELKTSILSQNQNDSYLSNPVGVYFPFRDYIYLKIRENISDNNFEYNWSKIENNRPQDIGATVIRKKSIKFTDNPRTEELLNNLKANSIISNKEEINNFTIKIASIFKNNVIDVPTIGTSSVDDKYLSVVDDLKKNRTNPEKQAEAAKIFEARYKIKRIDEKFFYYNIKNSSNEELTPHKLGVLIREDFDDLNLQDSALKGILSSIQREDILYKDIWEFNNCFFDTNNFEECKVFDKSSILTERKIGIYDDETKNTEILTYTPNMDLNLDEEPKTTVEESLRQILIPKDNPKDTRLLIDFLQRVGNCLNNINRFKTITCYQSGGDNGKTILNIMLESIFNTQYAGIASDVFKDQFNNEVISGKNVLAIDELDENSFKGIIAPLKKISSGGASTFNRKMYSTEVNICNEYGSLFLFTNTLPKIDFNEKALIRRLDILKLPNTFVSPDDYEKDENHYIKNETLSSDIRQDFEGLSWFISAAIYQYQKMIKDKKNFLCHQQIFDTLNVIMDLDSLTNFIMTYIEEDEDFIISNGDITRAYSIYCNEEDISPEYNVSQKVGIILKHLFKNFIKDKSTGTVSYKGLKMNYTY